MNITTDLKFVNNKMFSPIKPPDFLTYEATMAVRNLHQSLSEYCETPLIPLNSLAKRWGVKGIYVKDESYRFGLNAFKGLGGIYALSRVICEKLGLDINEIEFSEFKKPEIKEILSNFVFITATDGNHGKGVAWAAKQLGCKTYVYMPHGSSENRAQAIRDIGNAEVIITKMGYDDTVRYAAQKSDTMGWMLIQDTSWSEYEKIPTWIIQGYTTMVNEAVNQLKEYGAKAPTHMFLQAGVGAMAGGVIGYTANYYKDNCPRITIVEPEQVACIYESIRKNDGEPHAASGNGHTIMAGLNCGEPCTITWPIIRDFVSDAVSCPDDIAKLGMQLLALPQGNDKPVKSGESGAVTIGLLSLLMERPELEHKRKSMGLGNDSIILLFNTEGDTDPDSYRTIIKEKESVI